MPTQQSIDDMALLRLFGHPVLERDGLQTPIGVPPKAVALLAVLAANHTRPLSREWLAQSLWPDADPADARANLRRQLHLLSRAVGEDVFLLSRHTAQWNAQSSTAVDTVRFDTFSGAEPALAAQEYAGELCAGVEDEILDPLRLRYRSEYEALLRRLTSTARSSGDDATLALWLQYAINHDPFDESAVREMMMLRGRHGDRAGALREYTAFAQRLRSELGTEPEPETAALFTEIAGEETTPGMRHNLQSHATTFVGRERELSEVAQTLESHGIVTLTGPGGIGKTRLATRVCFDMLPAYPDGTWFVELDHCRNADSIWERMAGAMQLPASANAERGVLEYLGNKRVLLFLDTCEHVVDEARHVAQTVLANTSARILATSRRALRIPQEHVIAVGPLEIPPPQLQGGESPLRFGAYRLFLERAAMINPTFRVSPRDMRALTDVLEQIDGLPLAIELVASRANVLTIEGMRTRLALTMRTRQRGVPAVRAQTIDDTIAWSYDLLSEGQRQAFAWLSVFQGTFEIEDVETVCAGLEQLTESLFELVDASLVSIISGEGQTRYRMLETTRDFAAKKLRHIDERAALTAHAKYFSQKAEALAQLPDAGFSKSLRPTMMTLPDYLASFDYANEQRIPGIGIRILEGLHRFGMRRHFTRELLERALHLSRLEMDDAQRARVARLTGMLAEVIADYPVSLDQFEVAIEYYRREHDEVRLCDALTGLAVVAFHMGRYQDCEERLLEILERGERIGDAMLVLKTQGRLGAVYLSQAQFEKSLPLLQAAANGLLEIGELRQSAIALKNVGTAAHYAAQHEEAIRWLDRAIENCRRTSELAMLAMALCTRASALRELGRVAEGVDSLLEASPLLPSLSGSDITECLEDAASLLAACRDYENAARLLGYCDALRARIGSPLNPGLRSYYDRTKQSTQEALGATFGACTALGMEATETGICLLATQALMRLQGGAAQPACPRPGDSEDTTSLS